MGVGPLLRELSWAELGSGGAGSGGSEEDDFIAANALESQGREGAVVIAQTPQPGRRVVEGDTVRVVLGHPAAQ